MGSKLNKSLIFAKLDKKMLRLFFIDIGPESNNNDIF